MSLYKEGAHVPFTIKKLIELESEEYYVLEDTSGQKQLLEANCYKHYNFKIGNEIICRIDHINCSGKVFLEPQHPVYKENDICEFTIDKIEKTENRLKETVFHIFSEDKTGNTAVCITENPDEENRKKGENVLYKIERIKKGKIYLSIVNDTTSEIMKPGVFYKFKIEAIKTLADNFDYYILSDKKSKKHLLRSDFYPHHNLKVGKTVKCRVIKYASTGYRVLEPEHPYYKIGRKYDFEFVRQTKDFKGKITGNYTIIVKDIFGDDLQFETPDSIISGEKIPKKLHCRVNDVKKGKPILEIG